MAVPTPGGKPNVSPQEALLRMSSAYWVSQMIYATAKLGLADIMADGPKTAAEIAPVVRADAGALA